MGRPRTGSSHSVDNLSVGEGGVLEFSEVPIYPPYYKNGLLMLPLNRSIVLGPGEIKGINLPLKFRIGSLQGFFGVIPNRKVVFLGKTNGCRYWGALKNYSKEPQQLLPWNDLVACWTQIKWYKIANHGICLILSK